MLAGSLSRPASFRNDVGAQPHFRGLGRVEGPDAARNADLVGFEGIHARAAVVDLRTLPSLSSTSTQSLSLISAGPRLSIENSHHSQDLSSGSSRAFSMSSSSG